MECPINSALAYNDIAKIKPFRNDEQVHLKSIVCNYIYLYVQTRPDIRIAASMLGAKSWNLDKFDNGHCQAHKAIPQWDKECVNNNAR